MEINVARDFSDNPGGRKRANGPKSGQEFLEDILLPRFRRLGEGEMLTIHLDGGYGYPVSFLDEAFGGLARLLREETGKDQILERFQFVSAEEPRLIDEIKRYIADAY